MQPITIFCSGRQVCFLGWVTLRVQDNVKLACSSQQPRLEIDSWFRQIFKDMPFQLLQLVFACGSGPMMEADSTWKSDTSIQANCGLCLGWPMGFSGSERFSGVLAFSELNPGTSWANWDESFTLLGLTVSKKLCFSLFCYHATKPWWTFWTGSAIIETSHF